MCVRCKVSQTTQKQGTNKQGRQTSLCERLTWSSFKMPPSSTSSVGNSPPSRPSDGRWTSSTTSPRDSKRPGGAGSKRCPSECSECSNSNAKAAAEDVAPAPADEDAAAASSKDTFSRERELKQAATSDSSGILRLREQSSAEQSRAVKVVLRRQTTGEVAKAESKRSFEGRAERGKQRTG